MYLEFTYKNIIRHQAPITLIFSINKINCYINKINYPYEIKKDKWKS